MYVLFYHILLFSLSFIISGGGTVIEFPALYIVTYTNMTSCNEKEPQSGRQDSAWAA